MKFDPNRFAQLAGLPEAPRTPTRPKTTAPAAASAPRRLTEAQEPTSDEARLREIIRREARRMVSERLGRKPLAKDTTVESLQEKKSLTEAITMGFAGVGFGGPSPALGGPLTSARRLASEPQVDESMYPSWNPSEMRVGATMDDIGRDVLELEAEEELGLSREEIDRMDDDQLRQALAEPLARR